jgi:hypothetical protein
MAGEMGRRRIKSFLLLFFKKEDLLLPSLGACFSAPKKGTLQHDLSKVLPLPNSQAVLCMFLRRFG